MQKTKVFEQWLLDQQAMIVRYREVEKGAVLAEYKELQVVVSSAEFQAKKKLLTTTKYADTPEGKTMAQYKSLKSKGSVLLYRMFHKESWKAKADVAAYLELLAQVQTPEFQKEHAFWKNEKRWWTTAEGAQEKRFEELKKHKDVLFFEQHTEAEVAELESYKLVWKDEFDGSAMSAKWETGWAYPAGLQANHSHVNEQQAYVKGANTKVGGSAMTISTKKEAANVAAWHPTKGMLMHDFAYTSDVWHSTEGVNHAAGVVQVKVACSGDARHAICLTATKMQHVLPIMHAASVAKGYFIYTLVWNEQEVVNYVNDQEVSRGKNTMKGEPMHILMRSYLSASMKAGKGSLSVDWVRVYGRELKVES